MTLEDQWARVELDNAQERFRLELRGADDAGSVRVDVQLRIGGLESRTAEMSFRVAPDTWSVTSLGDTVLMLRVLPIDGEDDLQAVYQDKLASREAYLALRDNWTRRERKHALSTVLAP